MCSFFSVEKIFLNFLFFQGKEMENKGYGLSKGWRLNKGCKKQNLENINLQNLTWLYTCLCQVKSNTKPVYSTWMERGCLLEACCQNLCHCSLASWFGIRTGKSHPDFNQSIPEFKIFKYKIINWSINFHTKTDTCTA